MASQQYSFGGKYDLIQLHRQIIHQNEKLIEIFTTSTFYLKFKENNENDMTLCYFSYLGRYCFWHTSMAVLSLSALARWVKWNVLYYCNQCTEVRKHWLIFDIWDVVDFARKMKQFHYKCTNKTLWFLIPGAFFTLILHNKAPK